MLWQPRALGVTDTQTQCHNVCVGVRVCVVTSCCVADWTAENRVPRKATGNWERLQKECCFYSMLTLLEVQDSRGAVAKALFTLTLAGMVHRVG